MKYLNGAEIADYMKAAQATQVRGLRAQRVEPKLVIIRNSDSPVIEKYVGLKRRYGEDIGVAVEDWKRDDIKQAIIDANNDTSVRGVIVPLPLDGEMEIDEILSQIAQYKDVDGLNEKSEFDSATATAINWLLAGYNIDLTKQKIAIVGRGRLVGGPLSKMWQNSGYDVKVFGRGSDLNELAGFDLIVSATGVPHLIKTEMIKPGAIIVDAGTASEGGVLVGDLDESVRERQDLAAITLKVGGVGPLTVAALFEHVLMVASKTH